MNSILIHAWSVSKDSNCYYLPYVHWVYLNEIVKYYDNIYLLSPTHLIKDGGNVGLVSLACFDNVMVEELPPINRYIEAIKLFFVYRGKYKKIDSNITLYARYPIPFGWLQKKYGKGNKRIIHFVGDPIDATKNNPNFSFLKKKILITLFQPEHRLYLWACKDAKVYTNGYHIAERLKKRGIQAIPLISSTLNKEDFFFDNDKIIDCVAPKVLYVGYLRKAKGVETVIRAFELLQKKYPKAILTIVGSGEFEKELKEMVKKIGLTNVEFKGHVDNREALNKILRHHDLFCFASLSEGSPRVILEAMANGINVVSTPVGSLPFMFEDNKDILFADFNNAESFAIKMIELIKNKEHAYTMRLKAYDKVGTFTIENFLKKIFHEA